MNIEPGSTFSYQSIFDCKSPPADPIMFKKFLPEVPGYESDKQYYYSPYNKSTMIYDFQWRNSISNAYHISSEKSGYYTRIIHVSFTDYGPCAEVYKLFDQFQNVKVNGTKSRVNFHGYPALHTQAHTIDGNIDYMIVCVNNRLFVEIMVLCFHTYSFSDADADIENFGNAIDFSGLAASI